MVSNSSTELGTAMDNKPEDAKEPTLPVETSAVGPAAEPKFEVQHIEAPSIVPGPLAADDFEPAPAEAAKVPTGSESPSLADAPVAANDPIAVSSTPPPPRASGMRRLFTPLAAAVVLASGFGAMAGALGTTAITRLVPRFYAETPKAPPQATDAAATSAAIAQLKTEIAALKSGMDAGNRNATAQFAKLTERFDRIDRAQVAAAKADMPVAKDITGSITPAAPPPGQAPLPPGAMPPSAPVPGWVLRDVYRGAAILQNNRNGAMIEVGPGDILPGAGRVEAVRRQDGHWVVVTAKGFIISMR
jgi:hypothetical protein